MLKKESLLEDIEHHRQEAIERGRQLFSCPELGQHRTISR